MAAGLFSVDLFASSGGHSRNQCSALGEDKIWTPGPWTTSLDWVNSLPFLLNKKNGKNKEAHHLYRILAVFQLCPLFCFARNKPF